MYFKFKFFLCCVLTGILVFPLFASSVRGHNDDISVIRWEFSDAELDKKGIPSYWVYKGKIGTSDVKYQLFADQESDKKCLRITADRASGVLLRELKNIDLKNRQVIQKGMFKYEIIRTCRY